MNTAIADAITRSISHNEIVTVDLSDCLDDETAAEVRTACGEWDKQAYDDLIRHTAGAVVSAAQSSHDNCDDVQNDKVWEMWGEADGESYRVHINLTA